MANNSTALVTGGAGFIGSHLTDRLIKLGYKIYIVDNLSSGNLGNINKKANFIKKDIRNISFDNLLQKIKPQIIYHFAAQSSLNKSLDKPMLDLDINLKSTVRLLSSLTTLNIIPTFIFASSAAVYSTDEKLPLSENSQVKPQTPYGISKLACEYFIDFYNKKCNLPYTILRFSNVYGPRQISTSEGGVVAIFTKNALKQKPITIYNTGNQTRDFIFVDDVIDACVNARMIRKSEIFNISTSKSTSVNLLASNLVSLLGQPPQIVKMKRGIEEAKHSLLSNKKAKKWLKWAPKTNLETGLKMTMEYYKNS